MRALVLGANGMLGQALTAGLPAFGYQIVVALGRDGCDIGRAESVDAAVAAGRPDVIFNAAAFTNVDGAETATDAAFVANALGPENIGRAAAVAGVRVVHYSTDFVFDGEQERPYDEFDAAVPVSAYGRSKLAGEGLLLAAQARSFVLRVGCLYGAGGRNFPSTILQRLRRGETLRADNVRKAGPTWVQPVVRASAVLARTEHFGLYHCTANGETTWADYARFLARQLGVPESKVEALPSEALKLPAARPRRAILDNRMLRLRGLDTLGTWQEHAEAYLASQPA